MLPRVDGESLLAACRAGLGAAPPEVAPDEAGARLLLGWLVERIARRRFAREDVRAGYCTRTPREVLAQACVPFTAPCADLSSVAALLLARAGIAPVLVLGGISRALRPVKFQCGLEVALEDASWVAGFGVARSFFYRGRFEPTPRRPWVYRRQPGDLDLDRPFLSYFVAGAREELSLLVPGYDLARDLRSHVWHSGPLSFRLARHRAAADPGPAGLDARPRWEAA